MAKRKSLAKWVDAQREQGLEPDIAPELLSEAQRQSWRDMTVEDFRGLVDAVRQIEHLGRLKNKLLVAAEKRAFDQVLGELVGGIAQHALSKPQTQMSPATMAEAARLKGEQFFLAHLKVANITQVMDGGETGGPVWSFFARSAQERANWKATRQREMTEKLMAIMQPVLKRAKGFRTLRERPALPHRGLQSGDTAASRATLLPWPGR